MSYTVDQFRADLAEPYGWPGGYPRFFVLSDGEALSYNAARSEQALIEQAIADADDSGWRVVACDINWEDSELTCAHTGALIESAYGND